MPAEVRTGVVEGLPQVREWIGRAQDMEQERIYRCAEDAFPAIADRQLDMAITDIGLSGIAGIAC